MAGRLFAVVLVALLAAGCGFKGATGASRSCEVHTEDAAPVAEFGNAAAAGDAGRIKEMLRDHPGLAKATGEECYTALHYAAARGYEEVAKMLLDAGADPNARTTGGVKGATPLHLAVLTSPPSGKRGTVELLLAYKAEVDARTNRGRTALDMATERRSTDAMQLLIMHGADVDAQDAFGWAPMHTAAQQGYPEIASFLLDYHADINLKTKRGETPLAIARKLWPARGNDVPDIVKFLVAHGAKD